MENELIKKIVDSCKKQIDIHKTSDDDDSGIGGWGTFLTTLDFKGINDGVILEYTKEKDLEISIIDPIDLNISRNLDITHIRREVAKGINLEIKHIKVDLKKIG